MDIKYHVKRDTLTNYPSTSYQIVEAIDETGNIEFEFLIYIYQDDKISLEASVETPSPKYNVYIDVLGLNKKYRGEWRETFSGENPVLPDISVKDKDWYILRIVVSSKDRANVKLYISMYNGSREDVINILQYILPQFYLLTIIFLAISSAIITRVRLGRTIEIDIRRSLLWIVILLAFPTFVYVMGPMNTIIIPIEDYYSGNTLSPQLLIEGIHLDIDTSLFTQSIYLLGILVSIGYIAYDLESKNIRIYFWSGFSRSRLFIYKYLISALTILLSLEAAKMYIDFIHYGFTYMSSIQYITGFAYRLGIDLLIISLILAYPLSVSFITGRVLYSLPLLLIPLIYPAFLESMDLYPNYILNPSPGNIFNLIFTPTIFTSIILVLLAYLLYIRRDL